MGICVEQYRARIGSFGSLKQLRSYAGPKYLFEIALRLLAFSFCHLSMLTQYVHELITSQTFFYLLYIFLILLLSWDIEINPGPNKNQEKSLSVCHWNLNSLWVDDFIKVTLLSAFLSAHKFDILCLSETFLDSSISDDDPRLSINGYNLLRCDHPSNSKQGGVCVYYRDSLALVRRTDLTCLNECLVCEISFGRNRLFLTTLYRSPSQSADQFSLFKLQFDETINNINNCSPTVKLFIGDFNSRNTIWFANDVTNTAGKDLADLSSMHGLSQLIKEPTHILPSSSSCIDLLFTSSKTDIRDSGVLPSLFSRCLHQMVLLS